MNYFDPLFLVKKYRWGQHLEQQNVGISKFQILKERKMSKLQIFGIVQIRKLTNF